MQSDAHYHQLSNGGDHHDDDHDLWDQLNDQQSREVQQHQSRFHSQPLDSRTRPSNIVVSMAQSTAQRIADSTTSAVATAQQAWSNRRQRDYYQARTTNTDLDFDQQFGINDLQPDSLEEDEPFRRRPTTTVDPDIPNPGYPFVVLKQFPRQAIASDRDRWGIVGNMDVFLTHLYQYYYHRGLSPMVYKFLVEMFSLLFTLWLSRILMKDLDWKRLTSCKDEETCMPNWSDYYRSNTLSWNHWWLIQGYTILVLGYALFSAWNFWKTLQQTWNCQYIVHEKLGISLRKLQGGAVAWDHIVQKLIDVQDSGEYRTALQSLDPLLIAQRIMRKENFLLAFWNQELLDTKIGGRFYWCPSLEWSMHFCVLNFMFNHKYEIRPSFYLDASSLQRRLRVCGVVHALLLPFLILFVLLHFLFRNVYEFRTTQQYMGNKQWSSVAHWTFREFNELPHVLEQRLEPSYEAAESYLKLFGQSEWMAAMGNLLVFLGGAVGGILAIFGIMNDAILLHVQLWGRNLLWYAGIAGLVFSVGKALLPTKDSQPSATKNLFDNMDLALKQVSSHTHHYPEDWKGRGWDSAVYKSFGTFFDSKVKLFLFEMAALVLAPYLLIFKLPATAPDICEFCLVSKSRVPSAGDVCGYSTFNFDEFKDAAWDGRTMGASSVVQSVANQPQETLSESILRTGNIEDATKQHPKPRAREGKMEKSFFNFQSAHPSWKCSPSGQSLVDRVEVYKRSEIAAAARERDLYVGAAVRQLETLARIEEQRSPLPNRKFQEERLFDSHIPRVPTDVRNGGGSASNRMDKSQGQSLLSHSQLSPLMLPSLHPSHHQSVGDRSSAMTPSSIIGDLSQQTPSPTNLHFSTTGSPVPSAGLSSELQRVLMASVLDSVTTASISPKHNDSLVPNSEAASTGRQYYWLERFHEHLESQTREEESNDQASSRISTDE